MYLTNLSRGLRLQASKTPTIPTNCEWQVSFRPHWLKTLMSALSNIVSAKSHSLMVSEYREWAELKDIQASWSNLVAQAPELSVFVTPEWLFSWWRAYGQNKKLCVLVFTDPRAGVVGIAPLYWESRRFMAFAKLRVLRLMGDGSGDSDDLDFISKPGYAAAVAKGIFDWMRQAPWDLCEFECLSSESEVVALLRDEMQELGWHGTASHRPYTRVALPETWERYLKQLGAKERQKVGIRLRRLLSRHQVSFRRCDHLHELPAFLATLFALHQKRWETKGEPGSFSLPERRLFYEEMTRALLSRGWLELWLMEMDGHAVAAQIGMRYGNCFYALQEGFDPAYATDSVGYVLRSQILRECIQRGTRFYDFLYGDQASKQRWAANVGYYIDIHFARRGSAGAAYLASGQALCAAKDWFRKHAPARIWKALQTLRRCLRERRPESEMSVESAME